MLPNPSSPPETTPFASNDNAVAGPEALVRSPRLVRELPAWMGERSHVRPLELVWRSRAAHVTRTFNRLFAR